MSKDFDHVMKEIIKSNKEIHNIDKTINKDMTDLQRQIKNIEQKISKMDNTLERILDILNSITVFIEENDENAPDLDDEEDWTPYDERNFNYNDNTDDDDEDNYIGDGDWDNEEN
jgi:chromosome segregation ATPase